MESSSVCNQTKSDDRVGESDLFNHEYDYRPNWTTRNSVTNYNFTLGTRGFSREFSVLAEGRSHERRSAGHYKDLTETGNRSRKVSGTQGIITLIKFLIYKVLF